MSALSSRTERCAARRSFLGGQFGKPALDEVQPRAAGRGEVQLEAGVRGEPVLDRRRLVRAAVVEHDMHVEFDRDFAVERLQELLELDRAMAAVQAADHLAGGDVQRGVEAGCPGALVVVRRALRDAREHRQDRRGAVERLDLGLLLDAQHDRAFGRVQVEPDEIADLLDELRILGQLPGLRPVRLEPERLPDPVHRGLVEADLGGHRTSRPMRRVARSRFERLDDHLLDLGVGDLARLPRPRLVSQTVEPMLGEAVAPLPDRTDRDPEIARDLAVVGARGRGQHDP